MCDVSATKSTNELIFSSSLNARISTYAVYAMLSKTSFYCVFKLIPHFIMAQYETPK